MSDETPKPAAQPPSPELMDDLLTDQAAIRARLDQLDAELVTVNRALMLTILSVLLIGAAVYMIAREGEL